MIDSLTYPCITARFSPTIHEIVDDATNRIEKNFFKTVARIRQTTGPNPHQRPGSRPRTLFLMQAPTPPPAAAPAAAVVSETPIINQIIDAFGYVIYLTLAVLAVWGIYNIILVLGGLRRASLNTRPNPLLKQIEPLLEKGQFEEAIQVCRNPQFRFTALGQLVGVALQNRTKSLTKIKQLLVSEFHTEIIAPMEIRMASIGTIVRLGPLLGLLGTVASMIGAFGRIGSSAKVNPTSLAADIALALWATGGGLIIATPMMIVGNAVHARIRRLRDNTERQLTEVFDMLEDTGAIGAVASKAQPASAPPRRPSGSAR